MLVGLSFSEDATVGAQKRLASHVEAAGLRSLWANDGYGRDPFMLCQAWADASERLQVGVGVAQIPTRTPAQVAKAAVTLQEASGGRFVLGLGVSQPSALERWHGVSRPRPLAAAHDALSIIGALSRGETVSHDGEALRSHDFRLAISPLPPPVPLYLGAMGPKMLALAGREADGVLLSWESPAAVAQAAALASSAAAGAGRPAPELAAYVRVAVAGDRNEARAALAREVAGFWRYYGEHFLRQELGPSAARAQAVTGAGIEAVAAALGDDVLLGLGWYGAPGEDIGPFLAAYAQAGLDHLIIRSVGVGDPMASVYRVIHLLGSAGADVTSSPAAAGPFGPAATPSRTS